LYAYIARQPIYDRDQKVAGYELLYRDGSSGNTAQFVDGDAATRGVLSDAITVFGIPNLTNGLPAYINFTKNLLMNDFALLANPKQIVIEVMGEETVDDVLADKLRALRKAGYTLALEDFDGSPKYDKVFRIFDVVRVDFRRVNTPQLKAIVHKLDHIKMLAEKIETQEDFDTAKRMGFKLFQGYFFAKPKCLSKHIPSLSASSYGRLLNELLQPNVDYAACSEIIQSDVVLTYMFMRQIQTANYYRGNLISEIRHGMVMMGTEELRRWICLVMMRQNNVSHSDELPRQAYLRGRFIEQLMEASKTRLDSRQGFLMGMFSLLDRVLGVELTQLLKDLTIDSDLKAALLGSAENQYSIYLQYAIIYEMGNGRLILPDIGVDEEDAFQLYMKSVSDTDAAFQRVGGSK